MRYLVIASRLPRGEALERSGSRQPDSIAKVPDIERAPEQRVLLAFIPGTTEWPAAAGTPKRAADKWRISTFPGKNRHDFDQSWVSINATISLWIRLVRGVNVLRLRQMLRWVK